MSAIKVLIVDDSATMRALFTGALERSKELVVVGAASGADDARRMLVELRPDVVTLDIEMPGTNGIEFLREIMGGPNPLPVVMLSTLTQKGAQVTLEAIEIGAVDCFPKPTKATPDEFEKICGKLCKLVATAAKTNLAARNAPKAAVKRAADYRWDGSLIGIAAGMGGPEAITQLLAPFPAECPPVLIVHAMEDGLAVPFAARLNEAIAPKVVVATDRMALEPGTVYLAADPRWHVALDKWPGGQIRMVDRDPVAGNRPSADLLFSVMAKTAGGKGIGVILSGGGADGAAGLGALKTAGGRTFAQDAGSALIHEAAGAAIAHGAVQQTLPVEMLAEAILAAPNQQAAA